MAYQRVHKSASSWNPAFHQDHSESRFKPRPFPVQPEPDTEESEQQEIPAYSRADRDAISAKLLESMGGNIQTQTEEQVQRSPLAASITPHIQRVSDTAATIQRTVTQITPGKDNKIGKLLIVGRPERVFGNSMGDHTTAFATHLEAIKLQMEGKTLWEALSGLKKIYADAKTLPGYALKDKFPSEDVFTFGRARPHGNRLKNAETQLTTLFSNLPQDVENAAKVDQTEFALKLQESVNAYLEFRELIPLSAVNVMSVAPALAGKGKGESGHTSVLAQY